MTCVHKILWRFILFCMKYIKNIWDEVVTWCHAGVEPEDEPTIVYGFLYNQFAALDIRGITSDEDWRMASQDDYDSLITTLGGENAAGAKLKESGTEHWHIGNDGTNESGFNARGTGMRDSDGSFYDLTMYSEIWLSDSGVDFGINWDSQAIWSLSGNDQRIGFAIRLIKDSTTLSHGQTGTYTGNDGKTYRTICIGTQEWLADNLAETKYRDGSDIPNVTNNWAALSTGAYCAYNNDISNAYV